MLARPARRPCPAAQVRRLPGRAPVHPLPPPHSTRAGSRARRAAGPGRYRRHLQPRGGKRYRRCPFAPSRDRRGDATGPPAGRLRLAAPDPATRLSTGPARQRKRPGGRCWTWLAACTTSRCRRLSLQICLDAAYHYVLTGDAITLCARLTAADARWKPAASSAGPTTTPCSTPANSSSRPTPSPAVGRGPSLPALHPQQHALIRQRTRHCQKQNAGRKMINC